MLICEGQARCDYFLNHVFVTGQISLLTKSSWGGEPWSLLGLCCVVVGSFLTQFFLKLQQITNFKWVTFNGKIT